MNLEPLLEASLAIQVHVATVVPAFFLGLFQFVLPKGTRFHRGVGYAFMVLMIMTSVAAFFIPSFMGSRFSYIHLFIPFTIFGVFQAYRRIRRGQVFAHALSIASVYFGALIIAGYFAFKPGRIMHDIFFAG